MKLVELLEHSETRADSVKGSTLPAPPRTALTLSGGTVSCRECHRLRKCMINAEKERMDETPKQFSSPSGVNKIKNRMTSVLELSP